MNSNWTGKHPRTLTEAFGTDAESACAITGYRKSRAPVWVFAVIAAVCVVGIFSLI